MKILQLIDSLDIGGAERMCVNIANTLHEQDICNIIVATRKLGPLVEFLSPNVKLKLIKKKSSYDLRAFIRLLKVVSKFQPDIIHAHSSSLVWAVLLRAFQPKMKLIWHDHNGERGSVQDSFSTFIIKLSYFIDAVIVVNDQLTDWAKKHLRGKKENIVYLKNFPYIQTTIQDWNPDNNEIICVANLRHPKGHLDLIKAFYLVHTKYPLFKLKLVGSVSSDPYYFYSVQQLVNELNLNNYVQFVGSQTDLIPFYNKGYLAVLSSSSEGLPVSLLEYGLAGLPVVITDVGQCAEVVDKGKCGWLVPPQQPGLLAKAIIEAIEDSDLARDKALKLQQRVKSVYGAGNFMEHYQRLIKNITG